MRLHPSSLRITVVSLALATVGLGGLLARPAAAADWTVNAASNQFGSGRESFGYTINPGGQVQDGVVVVNSGTAPLHLELDVTRNPRGVGAWVHLDRHDVTAAPGESVEVPFTITLPKDAAPGDYVGGIGADGQAVPIRLRVGGALKPSLAVENVRVDYSGTPNPIGKGDATVTYTIRNTGNAILRARQTVSLSGPFGRWDVRAGKLADTPSLLPGQTWKGSAPMHDVSPVLRLTATVTLIPLLTDAAGSTAPLAAVKTSGHAWIVPWSLLLALIVVCGLVVAAVALRPRRRARVTS